MYMHPLTRASIVTVSILFSLTFTIFITAGLYLNLITFWPAVSLTSFFMVLLWTIGPYVSDLLYRHLYKTHFFTPDEFLQQYPELAIFIQNTCHNNTIPMPKIGIIDDQNPTAFTYGSGPWNSRIVFTKGLTTYLNPQELKAVLAHEIGHIVHYDFVVMAMSSLFVQILYELYVVLTHSGKENSKKNPLAAIGILSYV